MADAELLLTIDGTDVTDLVWDWSSVTLTDSFDQHATLSFTIRQEFGAANLAPAFADVRLVNLLTSVVLFEGVVGAGVQPKRSVDPTYLDTDVSCVDYAAMLETGVVQVEVPSDAFTSDLVAELLRLSLVDARIPGAVTTYHHPGASAASLLTNPLTTATTQFTNARQAIEAVLSRTVANEYDGGGPYSDGFHNRGHVLKWIPGTGWVLTPPSKALRGTAPVTLTAAAFGRPTALARASDTSRLASGVVTSELDGSNTHLTVDADRADTTNGYIVVRGAYTLASSFYAPDTPDATAWADYAEGGAAASEYWPATSPQMPHDVLVGHEVTIDDAGLGSVTGIVQSVSTSFHDGVYDTSSVNRPYFLDSGRSLDGTWNLDASVASTTPRRMRTTTMTIGGVAATFLGRVRAAAY